MSDTPATFKDDLVYRLLTRLQLEVAHTTSIIPYNAHDERDGFMHLSAPDQVIGTAQKHYAEHDCLIALGMDPVSLGEELKWEESRGGALFPHYYGNIPLAAVRHQLILFPKDDGTFDIRGVE